MASFSIYALQQMGFTDLIAEGELSAAFTSVMVYEVKGVTLPDGFVEAMNGRVAGADYRVALSNSVNLGCQRLVCDDFTESESDWLTEVKATGPFILISVGPTESIPCKAGRAKRMPDGSILAYDSFPSARNAIKLLEDRILPPVIASITLSFGTSEHQISLRKIDRATVGLTAEGNAVRDMRIDIRGEATVSRRIEEALATKTILAALEQAPKLHPRAAKYFFLGTAEDDQLKRFLFFFLSLEVETHAAFGRINHSDSLHRQILRDEIDTQHRSLTKLIERDISGWSNLYDRFVWCATCVWQSLDQGDVVLFKELKNARDDIAHGRKSEPPTGFARKAELLALKILSM